MTNILQKVAKITHQGTDTSALEAKAEAHLKSVKSSEYQFPIASFPQKLQNIIHNWNQCYQLPIDYYATGVLTAASAVIGNAFNVQYKYEYTSPLIIYAALVGEPGTGKTRTAKKCLAPIFDFEEKHRNHHHKEMKIWEDNCFKNEKRKNKKKYPKPLEHDILINDITLEKINQTLEASPKGVLYFRDELKAWIASMNQYRAGSDEEFWLSNWTGEVIKVGRVGKSSIYIKHPFISILGGIQPGILYSFASNGKAATGFFARILFAYPACQDIPPETNIKPHQETFTNYHTIIKYLYDLPSLIFKPRYENEIAKVKPISIELSEEAKAIYKQHKEEIRVRANETEDKTLRTVLIKVQEYSLRFSALLELLELACKGKEMELKDLKKHRVSADNMNKAIELTKYYTATALKVISRLDSPINALSPKKKALYKALEKPFKYTEALKVGAKIKLSESTIKRMLNGKDGEIFKKRHDGTYERKYLV